MIAILFCVAGYAANPFLDARDDKPVSAKFRGTQWSDDIGDQDIPLTARVVTTRIAKMPWGAISKSIHGFKIARGKTTRNSGGLLYRD
jgi:hypothetical protein